MQRQAEGIEVAQNYRSVHWAWRDLYRAERTKVSRLRSTQIVTTTSGRAEHGIGIEQLGVRE